MWDHMYTTQSINNKLYWCQIVATLYVNNHSSWCSCSSPTLLNEKAAGDTSVVSPRSSSLLCLVCKPQWWAFKHMHTLMCVKLPPGRTHLIEVIRVVTLYEPSPFGAAARSQSDLCLRLPLSTGNTLHQKPAIGSDKLWESDEWWAKSTGKWREPTKTRLCWSGPRTLLLAPLIPSIFQAF